MQVPKSGGGWESWLAPLLIAVLSGIVATSPPAQPASRSPNTTAATLVDEHPSDDEPIHARSWEDPLLAVSDGSSAAPAADAGAAASFRDPTLRIADTSVQAIALQQASATRLTIIFQELVSGPGLEDEEARRQERLATSMGLERAGFSPESTDLIRIRVERPVRSGLSRFMAAQWFANADHRCLVVFVPDGVLDQKMGLPRLRNLAEQLLARLTSGVAAEIKILRRSSSAMIEDLAWAAVLPPSDARATWDVINTGSTVSLGVIANLAKASVFPLNGTPAAPLDAAAWRGEIDQWYARAATRESDLKQGVDLLQPLGNWRLGRVLNSDSNLVALLKDELRLRRRSIEDSRHAMAVVCESDSPYGAEFAAQFKDQVTEDRVRVMHFLSGLDIAPRSEPGRLAYRSHRDEAAHLQRAGISMRPTTPVGPRHVDYVYRQLEFYQRDLQSKGRELSAVLICAYDQADKRPLIQLIRERFPDALVMTTDLHASLADAADYEIMRNVVVASHLGLRVSQPVQASVPPFRFCYQTAMFLAAIHAVGPFNNDDLGNLVGEMDFRAPRGWVYEIGHGVAVALPLDRPTSLNQTPYIPIAQQPPITSRRVVGIVIGLVGSVALCVVVVSLLAGRNPLLRTGEVGSWQRALRLGVQLLVAVVAYVLIVAVLARFGEALGEPWGWFDGVSAWPSELLRILAILLGSYFIVVCWNRVRHRLIEASVELPAGQFASAPAVPAHANPLLKALRWIVKRDDGHSRPVSRWLHWRAKRYLLSATIDDDRSAKPIRWVRPTARHAVMRASVMGWACPIHDEQLQVHDLLVGLRARTFARQILIRLGLLGVIFLFVGFGAILFLTIPMVPVRGVGAYAVHLTLMIVLGVVLNALVLLVLDAGHTCNRFVNLLSCARSHWPAQVREHAVNATGIPDPIIDSWLDVRAVGRTTGVVNSLIYFPIGVILLSAVAWHRGIDAWPHSILLIILYGLSLVLCVVVGWSMRRSAERVRQFEIDRLKSRISALPPRPSPPPAPSAPAAIEIKPAAPETGVAPFAQEWYESTIVDGQVGQSIVTMMKPARVAAVPAAAAAPGPAVDRAQIQSLIDRIEAIKDGAFAPWREDPIVRGLVLPLVGVLSVKFAEWVNAAIHQA